ncbi:hypothetical protein BDR04DRAFT_1185260 [Suillus decipiens]|nr:hypothetical protein BDR04DRAFT_1185260 [Suillus decipiens]
MHQLNSFGHSSLMLLAQSFTPMISSTSANVLQQPFPSPLIGLFDGGSGHHGQIVQHWVKDHDHHQNGLLRPEKSLPPPYRQWLQPNLAFRLVSGLPLAVETLQETPSSGPELLSRKNITATFTHQTFSPASLIIVRKVLVLILQCVAYEIAVRLFQKFGLATSAGTFTSRFVHGYGLNLGRIDLFRILIVESQHFKASHKSVCPKSPCIDSSTRNSAWNPYKFKFEGSVANLDSVRQPDVDQHLANLVFTTVLMAQPEITSQADNAKAHWQDIEVDVLLHYLIENRAAGGDGRNFTMSTFNAAAAAINADTAIQTIGPQKMGKMVKTKWTSVCDLTLNDHKLTRSS